MAGITVTQEELMMIANSTVSQMVDLLFDLDSNTSADRLKSDTYAGTLDWLRSGVAIVERIQAAWPTIHDSDQFDRGCFLLLQERLGRHKLSIPTVKCGSSSPALHDWPISLAAEENQLFQAADCLVCEALHLPEDDEDIQDKMRIALTVVDKIVEVPGFFESKTFTCDRDLLVLQQRVITRKHPSQLSLLNPQTDRWIKAAFSSEELVEIANYTSVYAFRAFFTFGRQAAISEVKRAVSILDKIEAVFPSLLESDNFCAAREMFVLRRIVERTSSRNLDLPRGHRE